LPCSGIGDGLPELETMGFGLAFVWRETSSFEAIPSITLSNNAN
jgi:hypothetical protein